MSESSKPPSGKRMKARAPPPPQAPLPAPRNIFRNAVPDGGRTSGMDAKENRPTVDLQLTLPQGNQTSFTEDGSKALMDLLVELCSRHHLNPALHTLELLSPEGHSLGFKPNALLGSLDVACVLIKEKVWEERVVRRPAPKVPEKTVRLMVNYHGSQKAVVRVNPFVPLQALVPVVCDKCEFEPAHVLLLKDSVSRHELPLDKSLTELGIKELYVHNQSLDSIRSSTASLDRAEKKGLLGIFQFSRRKTKTDRTSVDMDACDDRVIQITDTQSNGLSSGSGDRPSTLGQSQSVMNFPRMSPKAETKKRRAPELPGAPTPTMGHTSFEGYEMGLGSESQQRKRKAPAPPPTPASISSDPDDTSTSAASTPDYPATETPTPGFHNKAVQSNTVSATTVVTQAVKPVPFKTTTVNPLPDSPTPSSSTTESLAVQDSSSELSHSLDDSDADLDQAASYCSTLSSSTASGSVRVQSTVNRSSHRVEESEKASSTASGSVQVQSSMRRSSHRVEESEKASSTAAKLSPEATTSETVLALNLKLDEVENNRHSAMAWLHSMRSSTARCRKPESETPEEETMSLGSSSSGSSLPDQGYAASEGMVECEDSAMVNTQPTSPDRNLSLDERSGGERQLGPERGNSSDSDEGCATWGSRHRHNDISPQAESGKLKDGYEDNQELTAQLHRTLADFEADLADHVDIVSSKDTPYTMSIDSNEVPLSVVDMYVPVTAIDEVLEDFERPSVSLTKIEPAGRKGTRVCHQSSAEPQNQNNNACTAADSNKSSSANTKWLSQPEQQRKTLENKSIADKKEKKMLGTKMKETSATETNSVREHKTASAVKPNVDLRKHSKGAEIKPDPVKSNAQSFQERKPVLPPTSHRSVSAERDEEMHTAYQNNSSPNTIHGNITRNVTSRFGMKTFTVVPPKAAVMHAATGEPAVKLSVGAIKIDNQGNIVKRGISQNKVVGSLESGINSSEGSPLLGKAKAFWSSNERQESDVPHSKDLIDKAQESTDGLKSTPAAISVTTLKSSYSEELKMTNNSFYKHEERAQPKEMVKEGFTEPLRAVKVAKEEREEMESKISVSKNVQQPNLRRDLSFLKPSRRTSSQYVASAITKYTPKHQIQPSAKPIFIPNTTSNMTKAATHLTPEANPQPHVTVSAKGVTHGPMPVTLFGPVQKFRPVISKSVEKDTSLHSSLMDAIQTGGGRDRLKRITASGLSSMKKASYGEEENERSALLTAIRAQSSSGRLRKTKSEASDELVKSRKMTSEMEAAAGPPPSSHSPPSFTGTSPPVFTPPPPPPPPPPPIIAPPPPPPALPQGKPCTVVHPGANTPTNPALARDAMLEAIRSGSAAERLRKVAAPTNTIQVNGRLGTIQLTSSTLPQP
ncbi:Protein cordon-bleu [Liparis tanakae]|uniref:Protein cordon-bleu n=1 Tax=Liparis tanakae TaxID=230148 RepID=A0A4Z2IR81_9TELE|nr:Protein cordon-bleu [Liparis tanakae]